MRCPFCGSEDTQVKDSRPVEDAISIRRRRQCAACGARFTTFERVQLRDLVVLKADQRRVPFDREKIRTGVEKACYKRPVSPDQIEHIIDSTEHAVYETFEREVPSRYIGEQVCDALRLVDQVAFVRFASVYRSFQDVNDFVEELQTLRGRDRIAKKR